MQGDQLMRAAGATKPAELALRNSVKELLPELLAARLHGHSWNQLAMIMKEANLIIRTYDLHDIVAELLVEKMDKRNEVLDEVCLLMPELEKTTSAIKSPSPVHDKKPAIATFTPPAANSTTVIKMRCRPFPPSIKPLAPRTDVDQAVYDSDEAMEHPAIPSLMLSKVERICGALLEYADTTGQLRVETPLEKRFRITWVKPYKNTPTATSKDFVKIDESLFSEQASVFRFSALAKNALRILMQLPDSPATETELIERLLLAEKDRHTARPAR